MDDILRSEQAYLTICAGQAKAGDNVVVLAAGSGVGTAAVQVSTSIINR